MDRDGMSNLYRGPSIDASCQVSVHLAKRLQKRRIFQISQSETRVAYGGHVCGQMYRNLVGSIYGKSSAAIAYVVLIR
jgi:hypothetical protein